MRLDSPLPSDEWQVAGVHWHAIAETRESDKPDAVLRDPWAVASWIDARTREHVHHVDVYANRNGVWVAIGGEDDLEHLRQENYLIASRGDSVYTDIYSESDHHDLYVEAVTDAQCTNGCTAGHRLGLRSFSVINSWVCGSWRHPYP